MRNVNVTCSKLSVRVGPAWNPTSVPLCFSSESTSSGELKTPARLPRQTRHVSFSAGFRIPIKTGDRGQINHSCILRTYTFGKVSSALPPRLMPGL